MIGSLTFVRQRLGGMALVLVSVLAPPSASANQDHLVLDPTESACEFAEDCFRHALAPSAPATVPADRLASKLERLRRLGEQHPSSLWAKRAGLLSGILLIERKPAEALLLLRAAQRDLPILDDYIRLWIGEALLKSGDASVAASFLEAIPEVVPDTLLGPRAAFRSGEAWSRAGECGVAVEPLSRAVAQEPLDPDAAHALLLLSECLALENRSEESQSALRQLWTRYPQTPEADEATARLARGTNGAWKPTAEERYGRATAFLALFLNEEAAGAFKEFLSAAPTHPKRDEAKLKLGTALARLKRYDQARQVFQELVAGGVSTEANEAAVWLARVYLRLGDGERLTKLPQTVSRLTLSPEQQATLLIIMGVWFEDQSQFDQAVSFYRQVAQLGDQTEQKAEALWRIGWVQYRTGQHREAAQTLQELVAAKDDPQANPQALYWTARSLERLRDAQATDVYATLCRKYAWTYYCQLVRSRFEMPPAVEAGTGPNGSLDDERGVEIARDVHYRRAMELKALGLEQDAGRELASVMDRYARDRTSLIELATRLSEAGAYHQALRLARLHFRDSLERGVEPAPQALWSVAYPTAYLATIRVHAGHVDPYLAAAVIREESQYDARAVSRVGALGLMQLMLATAQAVAQRSGGGAVARDELFDQETNIRYGVRYLEQLLDQFGGNLVHAVAAYNAGTAAVSGWIQKYGDKDLDEFVELIPYQETRQYVRRVLRSYREYHRLGGDACAVRSLDKVC